MTALHSKLGASSMSRWSNCPGSVRFCEGIESKSSSYAEEGTRAHEVAAFVLENRGIWPAGVSEEVFEAVSVYIDAIKSDTMDARFSRSMLDAHMLVEHRFDLSSIYPGCFGTSDCVVHFPDQDLVRVYDYKHGAGVAVEVVGNLQLQYYGLGALVSSGFKAKDIELVVVQPRCFHPDGPIRRWRFPTIDLLDFAADLVEAAKRTEDPNAPLIPGQHCRFCPGAGICPSLHSKAIVLAKEEFKRELSYNPEQLAHILHWLPTLENWISSVREFAYSELNHGKMLPGWKLVPKRANRKWLDHDGTIKTLLADCGLTLDQIFTKKLKTPAQIEKLIAKNGKEILTELTVQESTGYTLVPESDSRENIRLLAEQEFSICV